MSTPEFRVGDQVAEKQPSPLSTRTVGVVVYIFGSHTIRDVVAVKFGDDPPIAFHTDDLHKVARRLRRQPPNHLQD
jgi:uncharacterized membrane protein